MNLMIVMGYPHLMSETTELVDTVLDQMPARIRKVLEAADEMGWTQGKISLCVRLSKPDDTPDRAGYVALPFYATWTLDGFTPKGRPSWHFMGAAAKNGQQLNEDDILVYLDDPAVIYPEPPEESASDAVQDDA